MKECQTIHKTMSHKEEINRKKAREVSHSLAATWQRTSRSGGIISQTARSQSQTRSQSQVETESETQRLKNLHRGKIK
ncbi:hypothetical protein M5D96_007649 [Drosophila gunungcola]|uniref:Uncharacterized protein n=1 Tax=Drosophila gunungcola TaxID=103775 RepID=A0A9Q0BPB9_9MUSC|nr:hypothetical protein M5D96_007649 [Drosophila gunungcola]